MRKHIIQFALWLLKKCKYQTPVVTDFRQVVPNEVIMQARELCSQMDAANRNMSGEWKRAQVYRAMLNIFEKQYSKRQLDFAIAAAMQEVGF